MYLKDGQVRLAGYTDLTGDTLVRENNPVTTQNVDANIVSVTNVASGTYRVAVDHQNYNDGSLQWNISGGVTLTFWASNDEDADATADTGWEDITVRVTGNTSEVDNSGIAFLDTKFRANQIMVKYVTSDSSNAVDVWYNKGN